MRHTLTFATTFSKEWQFGKQSSAYFISGFWMVFPIQDMSGPTEHAINGFIIFIILGIFCTGKSVRSYQI